MGRKERGAYGQRQVRRIRASARRFCPAVPGWGRLQSPYSRARMAKAQDFSPKGERISPPRDFTYRAATAALLERGHLEKQGDALPIFLQAI